jgi:hypothetical protein
LPIEAVIRSIASWHRASLAATLGVDFGGAASGGDRAGVLQPCARWITVEG